MMVTGDDAIGIGMVFRVRTRRVFSSAINGA